MKHGHTIITMFAMLSLGALTLWAIHDLWIVLLVLVVTAVVFSSLGNPKKNQQAKQAKPK